MSSIIASVRDDVLRDHAPYISSYAETKRNSVKTDVSNGLHKIKEYRELMAETAIRYPRLFSYIMNRSEASKLGITQSNLQHEIMMQFGGNRDMNMTGGGVEDIKLRIAEITRIIQTMKGTDLSQVKESAQRIMKQLTDLEAMLKDDPRSLNINQAAIMEKFQTLSTILANAAHGYTKTDQLYDVVLQVPPLDVPSLEGDETFSKIVTDVSRMYASILNVGDLKDFSHWFMAIVIDAKSSADAIRELESLDKKLSEGLASTADLTKKPSHKTVEHAILTDALVMFGSKQIGLAEQKSQAIKVFSDIMTKVKGVPASADIGKYDKLTKLYNESIKKMLGETEKIETATDALRKTVADLTNHNKDEGSDYSIVRSYVQPELSFVICALTAIRDDKYIGFTEEKRTIEDILNYADPLRASGIIMPYEHDDQTKTLIDEVYKIIKDGAGAGASNTVQRVQTIHNTVLAYKSADSVTYKTVLDRIQEKYRGNDMKTVNEFYAEYNRRMTASLAQKIIKFVVDQIRQEAKHGKHPAFIDMNMNHIKAQTVAQSIRELMTNKMQDPKTDPNEIGRTFDDIRNKYVQPKAASDEQYDKLRAIDGDTAQYMSSYNRLMSSSNSKPYGLMLHFGIPYRISAIPVNFFTGAYTSRIYNAIFKEVQHQREDILGPMVRELSKEEKEIETHEIYAPKFMRREIEQIQAGGVSSIQNIQDTQGIQAALIEMARIMTNLSDAKATYSKLVADYIMQYNHTYAYMVYLIFIATNQFFTDSYVVYDYLNGGLIEFYKGITDKMITDLESASTEPHVMFVRKYYYAVIYKLKNMLHGVLPHIGVLDVLDIRAIRSSTSPSSTSSSSSSSSSSSTAEDNQTQNLRNAIILLNHFKPILESYNETFQNRITIYARLNDIKTEIDYNDKVFVSDIEKAEHENRIDISSRSKMWSRPSICSETVDPVDKPTDFTMVFDSVRFPENSDISKYMTLDTQLSKKKGICVMTYGYSGTGKTYTLFGTKDREGLLSSTLSNISGLKQIKFRIFEIYGKGVPYTFYWDSQKQGGLDQNIHHNIYSYNLEAVDEDGKIVKVKNVGDPYEVVQPNDFRSYVEKTDEDGQYVTIGQSDIPNVFRKFSDLTEAIDKIRTDESRIRETPNNPVSSRSVLVYDFDLYVGSTNQEDSVRFMILDLPGREEITQTYIEPYINKPSIQRLISANPNEIDRVRMIITCMALNPMALAVFDCGDILSTFNDAYKTKRDRDTMIGKILDNQINEKAKLGVVFVVDPNSNIVRDPNFKDTLVGSEKYTYQYEGLAGIFVMAELIRAADFNTIGKIYKKIAEKYINGPISETINRMNDARAVYERIQALLADGFKGVRMLEYMKDLLVRAGIDAVNDEAILAYLQNPVNLQKEKDELNNITRYDYLQTPFEGVYINENIVGLIKFLSDKLIKTGASKDIVAKIYDQPIIKIKDQRDIARTWLMSKQLDVKKVSKLGELKEKFGENETYGQTMIRLLKPNPAMLTAEGKLGEQFAALHLEKRPAGNDIPICYNDNEANSTLFAKNPIVLNIENVKKQRDLMTDPERPNYGAEKIFNKQKPLITDILEPYIKKIKDYKIFYLFGNNDDPKMAQLKCEHQIKLLSNTKDFIKSVVS